MATLRETKKARTREHIADVATGLFLARGFDDVSVAEVAEGAGVSKMTVFNYFQRKEDLLFDRFPEGVALLTEAVRGRANGEPPVAALRRLALDLAEQRHPLSGVRDGVQAFFRLVLSSSALLARQRESVEELEGTLAGLLAEAAGAPDDDPGARLIAALLVAAYRTVYARSARRILAGESSAEVIDDHVARLHAAFDAVEATAGSLDTRPDR